MLKKYNFILKNLDCANCAREIEEGLKENKELHKVVVNFNTLRLSYETDTVSKEEVIKKVLEIEPEVEVEEFSKETEKIKENNENSIKTKFQIIRLLIGTAIASLGLYLEKIDGMQIVSMIVVLVGYVILL